MKPRCLGSTCFILCIASSVCHSFRGRINLVKPKRKMSTFETLISALPKAKSESQDSVSHLQRSFDVDWRDSTTEDLQRLIGNLYGGKEAVGIASTTVNKTPPSNGSISRGGETEGGVDEEVGKREEVVGRGGVGIGGIRRGGVGIGGGKDGEEDGGEGGGERGGKKGDENREKVDQREKKEGKNEEEGGGEEGEGEEGGKGGGEGGRREEEEREEEVTLFIDQKTSATIEVLHPVAAYELRPSVNSPPANQNKVNKYNDYDNTEAKWLPVSAQVPLHVIAPLPVKETLPGQTPFPANLPFPAQVPVKVQLPLHVQAPPQVPNPNPIDSYETHTLNDQPSDSILEFESYILNNYKPTNFEMPSLIDILPEQSFFVPANQAAAPVSANQRAVTVPTDGPRPHHQPNAKKRNRPTARPNSVFNFNIGKRIKKTIYPYYHKPRYRYPYYDQNGNGQLRYGYGEGVLYEYEVFRPLQGYSRRR